MKTVLLMLLLSSLSIHLNAQGKSCTALQKLVNDLPNNFKNVKGEYESDFDGSKQYGLKVIPGGWGFSNLVEDGSRTYIHLMTDPYDNEEAARQAFLAHGKEVGNCFSLTGTDDTNSFGQPTLNFLKGNAKITLLMTPIEDKYYLTLTIEKKTR